MENNKDETFFIYSIALEPEYILLHASLKTDVTEVKNECEQMYEMAKLHRPIAILDMICNTKDLSLLDYYVKKYMLQYGIFYVRGGSYFEPTLPDYLLKSLECEFKTLDCYKKNYNNPVIVVPKYSREYIELNEQYRCIREIEDIDGNIYCITRDIVNEFEWISDKINFIRNATLNLIDYEMKKLVLKDKQVAKQNVVNNLKKDPQYYSKLHMLDITDEPEKIDETDYRTPQEKAIAEIMRNLHETKKQRRNWN
jgi:hypothetical protein